MRFPFNPMKKHKEVAGTTLAGIASPEAPAPREKRRPIHAIREGEINVSVWSKTLEVRGEVRTFYSFTIERSYRDRLGQYQYTRSFDPQSLANLAKAIQRVSEYLHMLMHPDEMLPHEERQLT